MPVINRTFTYRRQIKVSFEDLKLAKSGRKTCTIRLGKATVADRFIELTDGQESIQIEVTDVDNTRLYSDLTDEDAKKDGLGSKEELDADLRKFYGNIDSLQPMTVIHFKLPNP